MKQLFFLMLVLLVSACKEPVPASEITPAQFSSWVCQCGGQVTKYNDELKALADADNMGLLSQKMAEGDQVMKDAERCITDQIKSSVKHLLVEDLNRKISTKCMLDQRMVDDLIEKVRAFDSLTFK